MSGGALFSIKCTRVPWSHSTVTGSVAIASSRLGDRKIMLRWQCAVHTIAPVTHFSLRCGIHHSIQQSSNLFNFLCGWHALHAGTWKLRCIDEEVYGWGTPRFAFVWLVGKTWSMESGHGRWSVCHGQYAGFVTNASMEREWREDKERHLFDEGQSFGGLEGK